MASFVAAPTPGTPTAQMMGAPGAPAARGPPPSLRGAGWGAVAKGPGAPNAAALAAAIPALAAAAVVARRRQRRARDAPAAQRRGRVVAVAASPVMEPPTAAARAAAEEKPNKGYFPHRPTPLLDSLGDEGTHGLKAFSVDQLKEVAEEVRWQVLDAVSVTGGHLGAGLGVVELTVALHAVYDTPRDEIVWDVAHQCQPHKVLTGRRSEIYTLRQGGGLAGFAKRKESDYDSFGAGHSTTSISAAVGFETARNRLGKEGHSIAVIGDGAITGGMAWEAMNHAGGMRCKVLVILNDNGQVSLPTYYNKVTQPVGALAETLASTSVHDGRGMRMQDSLARLETSEGFQRGREFLKSASKSLLPEQLSSAAAKIDEYTRDFVKTVPFTGSGSGSRGELFEQLGFYYVGPIDGNNLETLVEVLSNIKREHEEGLINKPVFLHIKTKKGHGYEPAQEASDKLHAVKPKFNMPKPPPNVEEAPQATGPPPLTKVFAETLVKEAEADDKIVAITAAMPGGTGIGIFEKRFGPERTFDVGIAEQHAVTFAGGLAAGGLKPFCAIYSTFLQRGYDQLVHDVALQKLPVRFIIDRAGLVGEDGPTHGGTFDLSYISCVPDMLVCASADEVELVHMTHTLAKIDDYPTALRFPRANAYGDLEMPAEPRFLEPGIGRMVREGRDGSVAILSLGGRLRECLDAASELERYGISATVADARWAKPIDEKLINWLTTDHKVLITIEENAIGGFSAQVNQSLLEGGMLDGISRAPLVVRNMYFPDRWIDHNKPYLQYDDAGLNAKHIVAKAMDALGRAGVQVGGEAKASSSGLA